jgi:hypothetical protein
MGPPFPHIPAPLAIDSCNDAGCAKCSNSISPGPSSLTSGERIVARQKALVAGLDRNGRDTHAARSLLRKLEELLAIFIAHRDRLRADLAR